MSTPARALAGLAALVLAFGVTGAAAKQRTISFSGYSWLVKTSAGPVGPGPNVFSKSSRDVWVDSQGRLHLAIVRKSGRWYCAEVVNTRSLGYGTYAFTLDSPVDALDRNVVLGLFTWSDDPAYAHRELDIEFARWGDASDPLNAKFTVQPYTLPGHGMQATQPAGVTTSTQSFTWRQGSVSFASTSTTPASWTYTGADVPVPGSERTRLNLWLFRGKAPSNGRGVEVVVKSFKFTPAPP